MAEYDFLSYDERLSLKLREIYSQRGYTTFRMSRFEQYDLYAKNKEYMTSRGVITFTDGDKLMALKPDVTLSIIKNSPKGRGFVNRICYSESVFRKTGSGFSEIMQTGIECIGDITDREMQEVVDLAVKSLEATGKKCILALTDTGVIANVAKRAKIEDTEGLINAVKSKNPASLYGELSNEAIEKVLPLFNIYETAQALDSALGGGVGTEELRGLLEAYPGVAVVDFSVSDPDAYYSGISFKGYISEVYEPFLTGGRYDSLMKKMGKDAGAAGFAVDLNASDGSSTVSDDGYINIALPKGRLGDGVYATLAGAGLGSEDYSKDNRKLTFENKKEKIRYFFVKPSDVAIYVERGAADLGICGKDIVLESKADVYELFDLGIGKCSMCVACKDGFSYPDRAIRVATKFENIAREYYSSISREIDVIHLNGSIEIAPLLGLSDVIVDIVETGKTLKENGLVVYEKICDISAMLICNKISYKFKRQRAEYIKNRLKG